MDIVATKVYTHLSALTFTQDAGLFLAASNLTRQYWLGQLWYFQNAEAAPDPAQAEAVEQLDNGINAIATLPTTSNPRVVCGIDTGAVQVWTVQDKAFECMAHRIEHDDFITSLSLNADNTRVISSSQDSRIKVWDLEEFTSVFTLRGHSDAVSCVSTHPTEAEQFVSCSQDGKLLLWDTRMTKPASVIKSQVQSVPTCVCWQPGNEHTIAVGYECGTVAVQDTSRGHSQLRQALSHSRPITKLAFSPQSNDWLASGSEDSTVTVLSLTSESLQIIYEEKRHRDFVQGLAWHPRSGELYTCAWDGQLLRSEIKDNSSSNNSDTEKSMDTKQ